MTIEQKLLKVAKLSVPCSSLYMEGLRSAQGIDRDMPHGMT